MTTSETVTDTGQRLREITQESTIWLFALVLILGLTVILSFNLVTSAQVSVTVGEPADQDVIAPYSITYRSEVVTEQLQEQAVNAVSDVYTTPDLSIARAQVNQARAIFNFIDVVRADSQADPETKIDYLQSIEGLAIDDRTAEDLLSLTAVEFAAVRDDVTRIISDVMRGEIRDDPAGVSEAKRAARTRFSFNLTPAQERIVTNLTPQFIVPNSFLDQEATQARRQEAAESIEPYQQSISEGQRVVREGEIVTAEQEEMLAELGLLQRQVSWRDVGAIFMASLLATSLITLYWQRFHSHLREAPRYLIILGGLLLLFALGAKLMIPGRGSLAYLYPAAALSMLVSVVFDIRLAAFVTIVMAALSGYLAQESLELAVYTATGPLFAVLTLRDPQRINAFFRAGLLAALANMVVILVFRVTQDIEAVMLLELFAFSILNGLLSAGLTLAGFFIVGGLFGVMTTLQLQELSRLDHPLLQELLRRAPGTYHHSIMVANLAEQAAERVDANSTLVRVGAFYHDVGKMNRPPFFTENQEGINPHDSLDPYSSARIIINHVSDGLELARKHRLPDRIQDFIAEHHGDRLVYVFFMRAKEQAGENGEIDEDRFRYNGPRPRSRESGIVLLADSVEAASSAVRPDTGKEIERLVNKIVDDHLKDCQLDDSDLTMGDISQIRASFIETLKGRFHVRVKYPGNEELEEPETGPSQPAEPVTPQDAPLPAGTPTPQPVSSRLLTQSGQSDAR